MGPTEAPPTEPGAEPATAGPAGGGDAPVGSAGGGGAAATALAALALSTLPAPSDAHSLSVYPDVPVMKMFDFVDPYLLVSLFCVWIITSYVLLLASHTCWVEYPRRRAPTAWPR